jgi:hypothetical protein
MNYLTAWEADQQEEAVSLEWMPIDTAPRNGTAVLLWHEPTRSVNVGYWNKFFTDPWHALVMGTDALWNDYDGPQPIFHATHWMPLPAPPPRQATSAGVTRG